MPSLKHLIMLNIVKCNTHLNFILKIRFTHDQNNHLTCFHLTLSMYFLHKFQDENTTTATTTTTSFV